MGASRFNDDWITYRPESTVDRNSSEHRVGSDFGSIYYRRVLNPGSKNRSAPRFTPRLAVWSHTASRDLHRLADNYGVRFLGFGRFDYFSLDDASVFWVFIPHALLILLFALLPAKCIVARNRSPRFGDGHCGSC